MRNRSEIVFPKVLALFALTFTLAAPNAAMSEIVRLEVPTTAAAIEDCVGAKTYKIKTTVDVQKQGLALWNKNRNDGTYPLPPTFEYVVDATVDGRKEGWTCKIQKQKSGKWKVIESLSHDHEADLPI